MAIRERQHRLAGSKGVRLPAMCWGLFLVVTPKSGTAILTEARSKLRTLTLVLHDQSSLRREVWFSLGDLECKVRVHPSRFPDSWSLQRVVQRPGDKARRGSHFDRPDQGTGARKGTEGHRSRWQEVPGDDQGGVCSLWLSTEPPIRWAADRRDDSGDQGGY